MKLGSRYQYTDDDNTGNGGLIDIHPSWGGIRSSGRKTRLHSELGRECSASRCCATVAVKCGHARCSDTSTLNQSCCVKAANPTREILGQCMSGHSAGQQRWAEAVLGLWPGPGKKLPPTVWLSFVQSAVLGPARIGGITFAAILHASECCRHEEMVGIRALLSKPYPCS